MSNKLNKLRKRLHRANQQMARGDLSDKSAMDVMDEVEAEALAELIQISERSGADRGLMSLDEAFEDKTYRSDALAAIHETIEALHDIDAIDSKTMQEFDDACLDEEFKAAIEEGMEDLRNGRVHDADDVFAELEKELGDKKSPRRG